MKGGWSGGGNKKEGDGRVVVVVVVAVGVVVVVVVVAPKRVLRGAMGMDSVVQPALYIGGRGVSKSHGGNSSI